MTINDLNPTVFVLYGATGDLAKRMVLPAFFRLACEGLLPEEWLLVGNGRGDVSHLDFRNVVHDALLESELKPDDGPWEKFSSRLMFAGGGFSMASPGSLLDVIGHSKKKLGQADVQLVHYLAVPPNAFNELTEAIGHHGLDADARVVYEKPYGTSLESFRELDAVVHAVLDESQIFRIDHFLGKEATQNLHRMRFANALFEGVWDREHISSVQIDVPETLGVEDRAEFYDATGAMIDMIVTHLFQIAAEVAMEEPESLTADDLQAARESVIAKFRPLDPNDIVLGQFEGYRDIKGVANDSMTDTFAAVRLWIDSDRWRGVPFLLRTGKAMEASEQRVSLVFKKPQSALHDIPDEGNVLTLSLSGSGAIGLTVLVDQPGTDTSLVRATLDVSLEELTDANPLPPYVRLIHDLLRGDRSLFTRPDGLSYAWDVVQPILAARPKPLAYMPGSWGPEAASELPQNGWLLR